MPLCPTIRGHLHLIRRKKEGRVLTICRLSEGANMLDRVEARPDFISALFLLALIRSIFTVQSCFYEQIVMEFSIRRTLSLFRPILSISSYWLRYSLEQSSVLNEPRWYDVIVPKVILFVNCLAWWPDQSYCINHALNRYLFCRFLSSSLTLM